ncbi:MAG: DUF1320 family protein [Lentisphaeria bacterium]|nr:DUF1320 family protein [Lentisphaeria bacterium]MBO5695309.1 DUF1320 family protein [Lentisphaeria bacterium]MBO5802320.1 DUF1320 family protein [Lentisphaeria bacterium]MBR4884209.1 DUF1320 family protein [Lentisphaeria bacterium]
MGNYLTAEKLARHLGSRYDALTGNDDALIAEILARAGAIIEGFASVRYEVPLTPTPLLEEWALALAEHSLYKRLPGSQIPEKIREAYTRTIGQLSDLASNKMGTGGLLTFRQKPALKSPISVQNNRNDRMTDGE